MNCSRLAIVAGIMALKMPAAAARLWYAGRRVRRDGLVLDAKAQLIRDIVELARTKPVKELTAAEIRSQFDTFVGLFGGGPSPVAAIEEKIIAGPGGDIPARLYRPLNCAGAAANGSLPVSLFIHGGGWVQGGIATYDEPCRLLANASGGLVLSIEYRLAPENKFPAAVDDCLAAFRWLRDSAADIGADGERIAIAGDSAGGNLAAVLCQQTAMLGEAGPMFQVLIYPAMESSLACRSHEIFSDGFFLTREYIERFAELYMDDVEKQKSDPRISPGHTEDLSGQPPALIITAGFDPLRDEGRAYHRRLLAAGVKSEYRQYDGMIHAFINMAGVLPQGRDALIRSGAALKAAWG